MKSKFRVLCSVVLCLVFMPTILGPVAVDLLGVGFELGEVLAYDEGQCTEWVQRRAGQTGWSVPEGMGNAGQWDESAPTMGWVVDSIPMGGAIMVLDPYVGWALDLGHVAFVEKVYSDGTLSISECNVDTQECQGQCPCVHDHTAPSEAKYIYRPKPTLFEHIKYAGAWYPLTEGLTDFADDTFMYPEGNGVGLNDAVSSIWMPPLWNAIYFKDRDYGCGSILFDCPNDDLHALQFADGVGVGDNGSSIKISDIMCFIDWECGGQYADCTEPGGAQTTNTVSALTASTLSSHACASQLLPSPAPSMDNATFVDDVTIRDGTVVSPGEALQKTWRVRNSGTSTWGDGYQLAFVSGDQMGSPSSVSLPYSVAPGETVDISVNITAPSIDGIYQGNWRMRDPSGAYFGDEVWVRIQVGVSSNNIVLTVDPPSPASADQVRIYARVNDFPNLRALRILVDGEQLCELGAPEIQDCVWHTSGYSPGQHSISAEADDWTGDSWDNPERRTILYEYTGTGIVNHAPYRPTLVANPAYDWYVTIGDAPQLCAQHQGDPDGDAVNEYRFVATAPVGTVDSGWVGSSCHSFGSITPGTYEWHAQVRDSQGGVSDWSDSWHFTAEPTGIDAFIDHFTPGSPSNAEEVKIYGCTSGHAEVNVTMRVLVNDANDGTDAGAWHIIKEQGSACFNDVDVPIWRTLEYGDGPHLVRLVAWAIEPDAGDIYDTVYTLNHRRPDSPRLVAPVPVSGVISEPVYLNSRTVTFKWEPAIRANTYTLHVGTNPVPSNDANPLFRQTFDSGVNEYTVTFDQDYPTLYWQVEATNDVGSNFSGDQLFGIDPQDPTCAVPTLASPSYESVFQVNWSGTDNLAGIRSFDIQFMDSERGTWEDWLTTIPSDKTYDLFTGQPGHAYYFRCRATDNAANVGDYPGAADTSMTVDPAARPPTPWWDSAYAEKRNVTILNNMAGRTLPVGYPVHLHFDSNTTPTAAQIYNASQSSTKCNDLRVVYLDATQLDRVVQACSDTKIDIWFRTQVSIPAASSDGTSHQLYYDNAAAGTPPGSPTTVFDPPADSNTVGLWYMDEGGGLTLHDMSGRGNNCSLDSTTTWVTPAKFSGALHFLGGTDGPTVNCGNSSVFDLQTFTFEMWIKRTGSAWGRLAGHLGNSQNRWLMTFPDSGRVRIYIWPCSTCGAEEFNANTAISDTSYWHHVAFTLENRTVRIYIDGRLDSTGQVVWGNIRSGTPPLTIGSAENIQRVFAEETHVRLSNIARTSFPYSSFAAITSEPTTAVGQVITPPPTGSADLVILSLSTYPDTSGGVIVEAIVQNQGQLSTVNGFYTDLYVDHLPDGPGDYAGSLRFWVNDPIAPGETTILATLIDDLSSLSGADQVVEALSADLDGVSIQSTGTFTETSCTLYAQTDSMGLVREEDNLNNIYTSGTQICTASPDSFEDDDIHTAASPISVGDSQTHNFSAPGDQDWIRFEAEAGKSYLLTTGSLGVSSDTYLYLYDADGATLLAANDDFDGSLASQIEWTAPTSGTYYALVKHWNPNVGGCGTSYNVMLGEAVQAGFTGTPTSGAAPLEVQFTNTSTGNYTDILWSFGDAVTSTLASPIHTYTMTGTYTVTLTVSGPGVSDTLVQPSYVTVLEPVRADFSATPTAGVAPLEVVFSNTSTGDYAESLWDFGDGQTGTLEAPTHTYAASGIYAVTLTVSGPGGSDTLVRPSYIEVSEEQSQSHVGDLDGGVVSANKNFWWAEVIATVHDSGHNPVAGATVSGAWGGGVSGAGSCVTDATGQCSILSPKAQISLGSVTFTVDNVAHLTLPYNPLLNHDQDGDSDGITIVVSQTGNQPPVASFTYDCAGLTCAFDGSSSSDPDGTIVDYVWDFGDGNNGAGVAASHTYLAEGTYAVSLTVTDDSGAADTDVQAIYLGTGGGTMFVFDIVMSGKTAGSNRSATVVITVHDTGGIPLEGVTVLGVWSGDYNGTVTGVTDIDGTVTFSSAKVREANATFTFTVNDLVKVGFAYDPDLNNETSDTIVVP